MPEGVTIGDPEHIIGAIKKWESAGVDGINFLLSCVDAIPHEEVLDSLRLFANEVMPAFGKGRDDLKGGREAGSGVMLRGNRSIDEVFDGAPDVDAEKTGTLDLGHVSWLQLNYELLVGDACRTDFFPPGLHPTEPVVVNLQVWDVDDSPAGPIPVGTGSTDLSRRGADSRPADQ